jgi:hypothetical protein
MCKDSHEFRICGFGSEAEAEVVDPPFAVVAGASVEVDVLDNPQEGLPWVEAYRCAFVGRELVDDWVLGLQGHNLEVEVRHSQVDQEEGLAQADNLEGPEVGRVGLAGVVPLAEAFPVVEAYLVAEAYPVAEACPGEVCFEEGAAEVVVEVNVQDWLNSR